ncbi:MAG: T9SS type A sorting domain-containing protein [Flavobacteriales bacterium]|nr:T9SS type A sorting domain-containing protein [Flavobacteriales bacterium]
MLIPRLATLFIASLTAAGGFGQWQSVGGGVDGGVFCFEYDSDTTALIVAGPFVYTNAGGLRANSMAKWDGTNWSTEGLGNGSGDTSAITSANPINSLALFHDTLFVGTGYTMWHYDPAMGLGAYLVNDQWHPCGSPENWFFVMKANGRLFAGGRADTLYGMYMPGPKEWVGGAWQALPNTPFGTLGTIYDATYWQGDYYFSGSIAVDDALGVIRFDGVDQWSALGEGVGGLWTSHIRGYGDSLYAGGFFQPGPQVQSQHIQLWDGQAWKPFFPQVEFISQVTDLQVHEGMLYIVGIYRFAGGSTTYGILRYDGHELCAIGGPMEADNTRLAFFKGDLYFGMTTIFPGPFYQEFIVKQPLESIVPDTCVSVPVVGMVEHAARSPLLLSPNPAKDILSVRTELMGLDRVELLNALGQLMLSLPLHQGVVRIDVAHLPAATYIIRATGTGRSAYTRFIKL